MLCVRDLNMFYLKPDMPVLKDVNITCEEAEIITIIGPSGSGKTTLINILAGSIKNYEGTVKLKGKSIDHKNMSIGLIPQDYGLLPWKTVYGNIILPLKIKKLKTDKLKIEYVMEKLQIGHLKNRYPSQISGGQKQRVAIAKTFIMDLDLLLMDEPFSALDAITREQTQQLFMDIWAHKKPITLLVTHSIEEAVFFGKKILLFPASLGEIINIVENPAFGEPHSSRLFHSTCTKMRAILKGNLCLT